MINNNFFIQSCFTRSVFKWKASIINVHFQKYRISRNWFFCFAYSINEFNILSDTNLSKLYYKYISIIKNFIFFSFNWIQICILELLIKITDFKIIIGNRTFCKITYNFFHTYTSAMGIKMFWNKLNLLCLNYNMKLCVEKRNCFKKKFLVFFTIWVKKKKTFIHNSYF